MLYLSKSKYCALRQCPKMLWLKKYKAEEEVISEALQARFDTGNEVGDLAMGLFGDFREMTVLKENGDPDIGKMLENTKEALAEGLANIAEASFSYDGLYAAVDILRKVDGGYEIYEVKSSTGVKPAYYTDVAFQKYVLEHCGITVKGTFIVHINTSYVFDGTLDLRQFFSIKDIGAEVEKESAFIEETLKTGEAVMASETEPDYDIGTQCSIPYDCRFFGYCTRSLPKPNVFDLAGLQWESQINYYKKGLVSYEDLYGCKELKTAKIRNQLEFYVDDKPPVIEKEKIREFLSGLFYPLYFLDYETMQPIIPEFPGTTPYQQIPFQYSLHYIEKEGGELKHSEFLAESGQDPRRALAEQLCRDIPMDVCVLAYNKKFERGVTNNLADLFPDLAEHLRNIADHLDDLMIPFQKGYYRNKAMQGSYSIKYVLPALYPDDPALDYHNLEDVQNGNDAMSVFPRLAEMEPETRERMRKNLLKYCELDTFAMVKVWEELKRVAE